MNKQKIKQVVITAMLCALSFIAVLIGKFIPNVVGFLSYDPKDAIVAIAGFIYGPLTSVIITVIVSFIEMISISSTGIIGFVMNAISTCAFAAPAALIYKKLRSMKGAVTGLSVGALSMTVCMLLWNYLITPLYMQVDRATVASMLISTFLPFNLIKSGINLGLTLVLYKPLVTALRKARLISDEKRETNAKSFRIGFTLISVFVLAVFILLFLIFAKII